MTEQCSRFTCPMLNLDYPYYRNGLKIPFLIKHMVSS